MKAWLIIQRTMRHWMHKEEYHPHLKAESAEYEALEAQAGESSMPRSAADVIDTCLEFLRQVTQCRGSTTLTTFAWSNTSEPRLMPVDRNEHQCVNWNELDKWNKERSIDTSRLGGLE